MSSAEFRDSERWIVRNGVGIQVMETLASGAFLTALAISLGASNLTIGILAAIPHITQLAQIPAVFLVDRIRVRRTVYVTAASVARPMLLLIAVAALLPEQDTALLVITLAFATRSLAGAFLSCSWSSWMRDLVPEREMGRVFGNRKKSMIGIGIVISLLAAAFVDYWDTSTQLPRMWGFSLLYALAFFGGVYSVWATRKVYEPDMGPAPEAGQWIAKLREPFRRKNYRRLIVFLASWNFAINLAAPFFTVHMLRKMELDLLWVIGLGTLSQIAAYLMVSHWGSIADRFNNKSVMRICGPIFIGSIFAWTFTTMPEVHAFTIPLLIAIHIATGIASAGVNLASNNLTLKLAPRGNATTFLAASSLVNAVAASAAAILGGLTADLLANWELSLLLSWKNETNAIQLNALEFSHWDFYFFFAALIGLFALTRLDRVDETGDAAETKVLSSLAKTFGQRVRSLTAGVGLEPTPGFPIDAVEDELDPDKPRR